MATPVAHTQAPNSISRSFPELSTTLTAFRRTDLTLVLRTSWMRLRVKILRVYSLMRLSSAGSQIGFRCQVTYVCGLSAAHSGMNLSPALETAVGEHKGSY